MPLDAPRPRFDPDANRFVSFDGAPLGLSVWNVADGEPDIVVVGIHGMGDYAEAFYLAAPFWAERGVTTYAYDQRGHGRSPRRGVWPKEELLRQDLRTAVDIARRRHPDAVIAVVGHSMGGAVAMTAFASDDPPAADRAVFAAPGLRGWGALPVPYSVSLWMSSRLRPGWVVKPPKRVQRSITPSDNTEMLRKVSADPLMVYRTRIDAVHGVVSLMERAHDAAPRLPENTLMLYGANDEIIPAGGVARTAKRLPAHVRTAYYETGYHMILRDLQAETVWTDVLAFLRDPDAPLPSAAPKIPWVRGGD